MSDLSETEISLRDEIYHETIAVVDKSKCEISALPCEDSEDETPSRTFWSNKKVKILLKFMQELIGRVGESSNLISKKRMYEEIKERMVKFGYDLTASQIEAKLRSLERRYKQYVEQYELTGKRIRFPFKNEMEKILEYERGEISPDDDENWEKNLLTKNGEIKKCGWASCHVKLLKSLLKKFESDLPYLATKKQLYKVIEAKFIDEGYKNFSAEQIERKSRYLMKKESRNKPFKYISNNEEITLSNIEENSLTEQSLKSFEKNVNSDYNSGSSQDIKENTNVNDSRKSPLLNLLQRYALDEGKCAWSSYQSRILITSVAEYLKKVGLSYESIKKKKMYIAIKKNLDEKGCADFTAKQIECKFRRLARAYKKDLADNTSLFPFKEEMQKVFPNENYNDYDSNEESDNDTNIQDNEQEYYNQESTFEKLTKVLLEDDCSGEEQEEQEEFKEQNFENVGSENDNVDSSSRLHDAADNTDTIEEEIISKLRTESENRLATSTLKELRNLRKLKEDWIEKNLELKEKHYKIKEAYYKDKAKFYDKKLRLLQDISEKLNQ